jgi:hypothetical protein
MNKDELRTHFKLKACPNPHHSFQFWNLIGEWIWAEDCWSQIIDQRMNTYYFSFHSIDSVSGTKAYSIVVWKLKIIWGLLK